MIQKNTADANAELDTFICQIKDVLIKCRMNNQSSLLRFDLS